MQADNVIVTIQKQPYYQCTVADLEIHTKNVPDKTERFLKVLKLHFTLIAGIIGFGLKQLSVLFGYISHPCPCRILFVCVVKRQILVKLHDKDYAVSKEADFLFFFYFFTPTCYFFPFSPAEVRSLWAQLRRDEPHLLSNFEDFLARVTSQIIEANQEKSEMESALKRSAEAS